MKLVFPQHRVFFYFYLSYSYLHALLLGGRIHISYLAVAIISLGLVSGVLILFFLHQGGGLS